MRRAIVRLGLATALIVLTLAAASAQGQTIEPQTVEREVKAQAGRQIRVGAYFSLKQDCTPGRLPAIRLVENPANGAVVVRSAKVRATNVRHCLAVEVPAFVAFYRSKPDFSGTDTFLIEVKGASGKIQHQRIRVVVQSSGGDKI